MRLVSNRSLRQIWMQNMHKIVKLQDQIFRQAFLGNLRNRNEQQNLNNRYKQLHQQILNMTIQEQQKYATNTYLQYLHNNFLALHRYSRGNNMITKIGAQNIKDLVDPDKFPIFDLREIAPKYKHDWGRVIGRIRHDIGFQIIVRESRVEHSEGGNGVFTFLSKNTPKLPIGTFLGFVPGIVFNSFKDYKKLRLDKLSSYEKSPQYLQFNNKKILQFNKINPLKMQFSFDQNQILVDPSYKNPYALGHMINHPPPGHLPNVCFTQIKIPIRFFPSYLLKFLPYNFVYKEKDQEISTFGILALSEIKNNEQLYVDYNEKHIYLKNTYPEWLTQPQEVSPFYTKNQYQNVPEFYWNSLNNEMMEKEKKKVQNQDVNYSPGRTIYESDKKIYKILVRKINKQ